MNPFLAAYSRDVSHEVLFLKGNVAKERYLVESDYFSVYDRSSISALFILYFYLFMTF